MKAQSFQVRDLKNKIAACLRLIAAKVKSAILRLLELEEQLKVAMEEQLVEEQLDSFKKLKEDVINRLNEAAWKHLHKWAADPYRRESNEWWYLSKISTHNQEAFKSFQDRYEKLELASFKEEEAVEQEIQNSLPEISENQKYVGFGFLPN